MDNLSIYEKSDSVDLSDQQRHIVGSIDPKRIAELNSIPDRTLRLPERLQCILLEHLRNFEDPAFQYNSEHGLTKRDQCFVPRGYDFDSERQIDTIAIRSFYRHNMVHIYDIYRDQNGLIRYVFKETDTIDECRFRGIEIERME